jgi:hypothetical protein
LIGIVFAKTSLTQAEIGEYETFAFLAGAISFFWLTGLLKALLPVASENKYQKASIFSAFVVIQFFSIVAAVFLYFLQPLFSKFLLNGKIIPEIRFIAAFYRFQCSCQLG